jgi:BolA family transcriptional regulator, general stress-responsive regulator
MNRCERVRRLLENAFKPVHLDVMDESSSHSRGGQETHLRIVIVTAAFTGQALVQRHRLVNDLLREEFTGGLHALAMRTLTPDEWRAAGEKDDSASPPCQTGRRGVR